MTLFDFGKLIRHYLKLVVALPVVLAIVVTLAFILSPATYLAAASVTTNADLTVLGGYAQGEAANFSQNGIEVTFTTSSATQSIEVSAQGTDYGGCIAAANATVLALADDVRSLNPEYFTNVSEATSAENISENPARSIILAICIGLLIAVCIIVIIDVRNKPIKSREDIERASELPVIGEIPARDRGERLLANIRFATKTTPSTIAVVPVGGSGASITCAELANALIHSGVKTNKAKAGAHTQSLRLEQSSGITTIIECSPLSEGMGAAYVARDAEFTILCATEWMDSRRVLANVTEELKFANAKLGGVVFLIEGKPSEYFR